MEATIKQINQIKVDSLYGKKKHFNAADRKLKYKYLFNIPAILINIVVGSTLLSIIQENSPFSVKLLVAILSVLAAILTSLYTFLDFAKQIEGHRRVGNKYLSVVKGCERAIACFNDNQIEPKELISKMEKLAYDCDEANKEAESFHTNKSDYREAQKSLQSGEEIYLDIELNK